jgi:hypothetical protein
MKQLFEILRPGDLVMKISGPPPEGVFTVMGNNRVPDGACGTVIEGEGRLVYYDDLNLPHYSYGCYVIFSHNPAPPPGGWYIPRSRLMKITPDGDFESEELSKTNKLDVPGVQEITQKEIQQAYERLVKEHESGNS